MFGTKFLRKKIFKTEKKSFSSQSILSGSFMDQVFFGGRVTAHRAATFYRESSAVATAIDIIAKEIEQIIPVVKIKNGDFLEQHPVLELLKNPNEFEDYREFMGRLSRNYLLNHDAFVYGEGLVSSPPINLFAVTNQHVSITQDGHDRYPSIFHLTTGFGEGIYSRNKVKRNLRFYDGNLKEIYQIHGYSSRADNVFADSPLEAAALETRQQVTGSNHNLKIIENGGRLSIAAIFKNEMTDEEYLQRKKAITEQFAGSDNAGKIAVFSSNDMELKEHGQSNKDMDFANLDKTAREAIYMRYGVPLPIVSASSQTFNNFDRAIEDLYDRAILPYTNILFSGLTKMLRHRFKDSFETITFNPEAISALKGRMMEELKIRRDINIETVNELRQGLPGREPIEGGDIYFQPATLIPAGEDLFTDDDPVVIADDET
ncbi:MAG: phage portal protein [Candidatus Anammoxibacter sp.]